MDYCKLANKRTRKKRTTSAATAPPTLATTGSSPSTNAVETVSPPTTAPQTPPLAPSKGSTTAVSNRITTAFFAPATPTVPQTPQTQQSRQDKKTPAATKASTRRSLVMDKCTVVSLNIGKSKKNNAGKRASKKESKKHSRVSKRVNTPAFGMRCGKLGSKTILPRIRARNENFVHFIGQFIARIDDKATTGLRRVYRGADVPSWESWAFTHGFLEDVDLWKLSCTPSRQITDVTDRQGWGADSEKIWATKPIYFHNNSNTSGLQWVAHVKHVFPVANERLNWAAQFHARTRGLRGAAVMGFSGGQSIKLIYHQPRCATCNTKTKTFHVLHLHYQCYKCVNRHTKKNRLVTKEEVCDSYAC